MIKKFVFLVNLIIVSNSVCAADSKGTYWVLGFGKSSCGEFIKTAIENDDDPFNTKTINIVYKAYALGYLTGVNQYVNNTNNIMGNTDTYGVMGFIEKYCRENPLKDYFDALRAVATELYPNRVK